MGKLVDLTGMKFGRLTVIKRGEKPTPKSKFAYWICQCECGNITKPIGSSHLKDGSILSCGCLKKEASSKKLKEKWENDDFRQMQKNKMRVVAKKQWQDEEFRQMQSNKMRKLNEKQWNNEEFRRKQKEASSKRLKEKWQDEEFRQMQSNKMREMAKEKWQDEEYRQMQIEIHKGNRHSWKGGIMSISSHLRHLNLEWYNNCKQQANYTCQLTGKHSRNLHTHHLYAFNSIVLDAHNTYNIEIKEQVKDYTEEELKLLEDYVIEWHKDSSNAVVLCEEVHMLFHDLYGRGGNTPEQYEEFKQRYLSGEFKEIVK